MPEAAIGKSDITTPDFMRRVRAGREELKIDRRCARP